MKKWLLVFLVCAVTAGRAQDSLETSPIREFRPVEEWNGRKVASTVIVGAILASTWVDAYFTWWKDAEKKFTFFTEDWLNGPHLGIDKPGHFYGTYAIFKITRNTLLWGGHDEATAFWWATGLSLFNGLQIEIGDGFTLYGFDYQDLIFDFAGVGYGMLQAKVPFFQNINVKSSYWSATGFKTPIEFTKDYDALTIWLSFNMHNLLPESVGQHWPEWLNLAVGYGVGENQTKREFVFGIDLNFEGFSTSSEDWLLVERIGNLYRPPLPAIKFVPGREPMYYLLHTR